MSRWHWISLFFFFSSSVPAAQLQNRVWVVRPGTNSSGAASIRYLDARGASIREQQIAPVEDFLESFDRYGSAVAELGDLDGNGAGDLAVGVPGDDFGTSNIGALHVFLMEQDGSIGSQAVVVGEWPSLSFGDSIAPLGDLDGDGVEDAIVGAPGGQNLVWILFLTAEGSLRSASVIGANLGGFTGQVASTDRFGSGVVNLGDLDGDGVVDVAVGAEDDDDGGSNVGAVWVLFLNADGTVKAHQKISALEGGFSGVLTPLGKFGSAISAVGDLDSDGVVDLVVGNAQDDDGGTDAGAVWVLFLHADRPVRAPGRAVQQPEGLLRDRACPRAVALHHPQVVAAALVAGEGDARAVGAEARLHLPRHPARDRPRFAALDRHQVDVAEQVEGELVAVRAHVHAHPRAAGHVDRQLARGPGRLGDVPLGLFVGCRRGLEECEAGEDDIEHCREIHGYTGSVPR